MLNLSLVRLMEVIGEAGVRVPEEFRLRHSQIPWREISALRNRLIHAYDKIDFDILWSLLREDLPPLVEGLEAIILEAPAVE
jgi:uncharacterized protein with HEPN domain